MNSVVWYGNNAVYRIERNAGVAVHSQHLCEELQAAASSHPQIHDLREKPSQTPQHCVCDTLNNNGVCVECGCECVCVRECMCV